MSQEVQEKVWWYSKEDQRFGPHTASELKGIATAGQLVSTDLIWKEGLKNWLPASSAKGLFPISAPAVPPPLPPKEQSTRAINQAIYTGAEVQISQNISNNGTLNSKPAFWNPIALSNWSFFLTPIFGTYLVAENYKTMGKTKEAKGSMEWFYVSIAVMLSGLLLTPMFRVYGFVIWMVAYLANFLIWNFRSARKQNQDILSVYGKGYDRQPWGKVLAIGIAAIIVWQLIVARLL